MQVSYLLHPPQGSGAKEGRFLPILLPRLCGAHVPVVHMEDQEKIPIGTIVLRALRSPFEPMVCLLYSRRVYLHTSSRR